MRLSGQVRYQLKTPYRDGTTHIVLEPLDLMALLLPQEVQQIGRERQNIFYEGLRPVLCHKSRYSRERFFRKRLLPVPVRQGPPRAPQQKGDSDLPTATVSGADVVDDSFVKTPKQPRRPGRSRRKVGAADAPPEQNYAAVRTREATAADRQRLARRLRDSQLEARDTVREHPELNSTFLSIQAAREFAKQRIKNPEDRERFLVQLRAVMAASIQKGEPLPEVRLRDRSAEPEQGPAGRRPGRDEPTR
jgi:hypothetical protein